MNHGEYFHLLAEKTALERMIAETPEEYVIDRASLAARLKVVEKGLAETKPDERCYRPTCMMANQTTSMMDFHGRWTSSKRSLPRPGQSPQILHPPLILLCPIGRHTSTVGRARSPSC